MDRTIQAIRTGRIIQAIQANLVVQMDRMIQAIRAGRIIQAIRTNLAIQAIRVGRIIQAIRMNQSLQSLQAATRYQASATQNCSSLRITPGPTIWGLVSKSVRNL